jgi:asparagine synthase (glutamine-hydrolysing)
MCGIAGFLHTSFNRDLWETTLTDMARTIAHRGPDDEGIWFDMDSGIGLAHRRLSIIDLSENGHQPMASHSGRYIITYNGEIYNFRDIKKALEDERIQWRGHSDTEVILAAIEAWGLENSLKRFIGMFALALWDKKTHILHLCRDRLGIKPLYYTKVPNGFLFASELKPLTKHPDFKPEIDRNSLALFFRHNYIPDPYSIYCDTWKLTPGSILSIPFESIENSHKDKRSTKYWSAREIAVSGQKNPSKISEREAVEQLEVLLRDSVNLRMISDVPLGVFLSGGIDSSTIAAIMQMDSQKPIKSFSIGLFEEGYNEANHAREVAKHLGTEHTELYVTPEDTIKVIPELPHLYDEPFSDSSQIPTYLLSKMTRKHVTVSLSGDGGDELFGGYNRYFWSRRIIKHTGWMPHEAKKQIANLAQKISPLTWDSILYKLMEAFPDKYKLDMPGDRIHKLCEVMKMRSPEAMYRDLVSHWKHPERIVLGASEYITPLTDNNLQRAIPDYTHLMMYLDLTTYLPGDILTKVDRASMGTSLESRVPLLDHRLVEFAWKLPLSMKIKGNQGKWILRQVLYKYVPENLVERPKTGFGIPIDSWLRGSLKEWAESLLDETRLQKEGLLNPKPIRQKWQEHLSGKRNWQYLLWDVLMFQAWKEHNGI